VRVCKVLMYVGIHEISRSISSGGRALTQPHDNGESFIAIYLYSTLKMEAAYCFRTFISIYQSTKCHN
jgi:hypothetical protein